MPAKLAAPRARSTAFLQSNSPSSVCVCVCGAQFVQVLSQQVPNMRTWEFLGADTLEFRALFWRHQNNESPTYKRTIVETRAHHLKLTTQLTTTVGQAAEKTYQKLRWGLSFVEELHKYSDNGQLKDLETLVSRTQAPPNPQAY